jgi:dihydroneopterin aldolase
MDRAAIRPRPGRGFWHNAGDVDDRIHIEGLELFAHVGVPDEERATPQKLSFSLTFWPVRGMDNLNDEIGRAVNYAEVCAEVKLFVEPRRDKLVETLANAVARRLLEVFQIQRVTVELRKYILPEVEFVSVTVTRDRSEP